jgi:hypothetical protein
MHIILFPKAIREEMDGMVGKATEEDGLEEADFEVNNGKELGFEMVNLVNYLRDSSFGYEMLRDAVEGWMRIMLRRNGLSSKALDIQQNTLFGIWSR